MTERDIFIAALQKDDADARVAYLAEACGSDAALRARVEDLLAVHERAASFLESPPVGPAATIDSPPAEEPGTVVGAYKLLEQIGEGGFGVVFMAEQTQPVRRKVALKVLKPGMDTRQVVARFEAERQALAIMDHPNIAKVLDGGMTPSRRPYFVMELVKGTPITDFCDRNHLPPRQRLELFVSVCQAVQHAHQKGIIHRDLKPSNVLVTVHDTAPVVKVIDFGVAKALGQELTDKTLFTGFAQMIGTPLYMSPEQAGQSGLDIDTRSDIYSLGVLLYELLTGTTPFTKERFQKAAYDEIRRIIREEEPSKPSTKLSTADGLPTLAANRGTEPAKLTRMVRGELDWIVMKALEKDRSRRYETANGFAADVQHYLADEAVQACPPSAGYRLRKFARRNKSGLVTAGLVLFFLVLLGGGAGWALRDRSNRLAVTADRVEKALGESEELYRQGKLPEAVAAAQKARGLLQSGGGSDALERRVREWLADLDMVVRLEEWSCQSIDLDWAEADAGYVRAFRDYGIDVELLPPAEAAERIAARPIKVDLAVTLDRVAAGRKFDGGDPARWRLLQDIARAADPDPWRNRVRAAYEARDEKDMARLAGNEQILSQPSTTVMLLTNVLFVKKQGRLVVEVLRRVQPRLATDFWINTDLGSALLKTQPPQAEEAAGFFRAALAVRPQSPAARYNLGVALKARGKFAEAVTEFRIAVKRKPDYIQAWTSLGSALTATGQSGEAIAALREAIRVNPAHAQLASLWASLGDALAKSGDRQGALAAVRDALRLRPDAGGLRYYVGNVYRHLGMPDEAIVAYREAIRLKFDTAELHTHLGLANLDKGLKEEAAAEYRTALRLDPDLPEPRGNLAELLVEKGSLEEAVKECRETIRRNPQFALAHYTLGRVADKKGLWDEAIAQYGRAIELDPRRAELRTGLGNALYRSGRLDEAIATYREATRLKPDYALAHSNLGVLLGTKGLREEAVAAWREAVRLEPHNAAAHHQLGQALKAGGDLDGAEHSYREAVRLDGKHHGAAIDELVQLLLSRGNLKEAIATARAAAELAPPSASAWHVLGCAHYRAGDWKASIEALEKSCALDDSPKGGDANQWFFLAMAHWQLNQKQMAREWYDRAAGWVDKNAPTNEELRRLRAEAAGLLGVAVEVAPPPRQKK